MHVCRTATQTLRLLTFFMEYLVAALLPSLPAESPIQLFRSTVEFNHRGTLLLFLKDSALFFEIKKESDHHLFL